MSRRPWLAAAGLSIYICLVLWMQRTGGSRLYASDLAGSCLWALAAVAAGWFLSRTLTEDRDRRGLIALVFGLWGLLFSSFQLLSEEVVGSLFQSHLIAAAAWTLLCGALCWLISRGSRPLSFVTRALGIATIILLATQSAQAMQRIERVKPTVKVPDRRDGKLPDVFIIVLDKYSSGAWLSHSYGLDHQPFEDSLRALGFAVPRAARANYAHTQLALASFLNWSLFEPTPDSADRLSWERMRALISRARTWEVFREKGYRVFAFPSTFPATRTLEAADVPVRPAPRQLAPFGETWRVNSPLASWTARGCDHVECRTRGPMPYPAESLADIEWKLKTLESLPDSAGPIVAFMHLLAPHEPYLFEADCSARLPWWPLSDQGADGERIRKAYAIQVACLDRILLRTVRALSRRAGPRPVIILQGDHGHGLITVDPLRGFTLTSSELPAERLGERFGVFAAYLFPGADTAIADDISAVNVMPLVLRSIFGSTYPRQPDRSFWSTYQDAFSFSEIDPALTRPPDLRGRKKGPAAPEP